MRVLSHRSICNPTFSRFDAGDHALMNCKSLSDLPLCSCSSADIFGDLTRNLHSPPIVTMPLSPHPTMPTFCRHVRHVVGNSSKEKMTRIDATRVVASMQYAQTRRDFSVGKLPTNPVREGSSGLPVFPNSEISISLFVFASCPLPASFGQQYFLPVQPLSEQIHDACSSIEGRLS